MIPFMLASQVFTPNSTNRCRTLILCFLALTVLPFCARGADLYHIRPLNEKEIQQTYLQMLHEACLRADAEWKTSAFDPHAGYWGDGVSAGNEGIRAIGGMVLGCATLFKYDDSLTETQRQELLTKIAASLRFVTATHITGSQKCTNGKPWGATPRFGGESWQSGMWTGTLAFGAYLVWDQLDPTLQRDLERVIAWEDDILDGRAPPNGLWLDTKAEENGWEVPCLVLGELMFPSHPHAAAWHQTAVKYMLNTLCTQSDTQDSQPVDGRPLSQWIKGANLQPDYTLENHNIFHPAYVGCSSYFLTQAQMYYAFAKRPIPFAAGHHLLDTWHMFKSIILPWGEAAYPQGMDWELHGLPFINLYATLATHGRDAYASRMEQCSLQYMCAWQKMDGGSLAFPGSRLGFTRHSINIEQLSYGLLAHQIFGPSVAPLSDQEAAKQEQGVWDYPYVQFIAHRTAKKFVSFSWKNRVMGMLIPIEAHEGEPDFTTPVTNGFVGSFELVPRDKATMKVIDHANNKTSDGFETSGTVMANDGKLKQKIRMISIGSQTVVYEDQVIAAADVKVMNERGVPIGIENDQISGGTRSISSEEGQFTISFQKPDRTVHYLGSWANVDGRLGVVMVSGGGIAYQQAADYSRGISVCSDILYGSYSDQTHQFKAGDVIAHRVTIFFVEVPASQTSDLAKSCRIEKGAAGDVLHFKQPDGTETQVPLPAMK